MAEIPHRAYPLRLNEDGTFQTVEQDTLEHVRQCVHVLLRTPLGARPLAPQVGVADPTFQDHIDGDTLAASLMSQDMEPRADVTVVVEPADQGGEQQIRVRVALADDPEVD